MHITCFLERGEVKYDSFLFLKFFFKNVPINNLDQYQFQGDVKLHECELGDSKDSQLYCFGTSLPNVQEII